MMSLIIIFTFTFSLVLLAWFAALALVCRSFYAPRQLEQSSPAELGPVYHEIRIPTVRGKKCIPTVRGKKLFCWLIPASLSRPKPVVAVLHGRGGNAEDMLPFAPLLHRTGLDVLLIDAHNHGRFEILPRLDLLPGDNPTVKRRW
ncbi:hypothetical protein BCL69_10893 [Nitrosomonas communis]|uniref:Uncharacterized protein n=3 Tax=Nitrosomonadaceae TaxID=206379 RepID=A0A5D3Y7J4_9PROT|nr:hypothetical protein [Nitrosomonas communis]TYP74424.1 hypothetical protein BCL69_10893 [Nitrosomonas communis]